MTKDEMKNALVESICEVVFEKKDGTMRTMRCTLDPTVLPTPVATDEEVNRNRTPNDEVQVVWDVDSNGWRSFRINSVKEFKV